MTSDLPMLFRMKSTCKINDRYTWNNSEFQTPIKPKSSITCLNGANKRSLRNVRHLTTHPYFVSPKRTAAFGSYRIFGRSTKPHLKTGLRFVMFRNVSTKLERHTLESSQHWIWPVAFGNKIWTSIPGIIRPSRSHFWTHNSGGHVRSWGYMGRQAASADWPHWYSVVFSMPLRILMMYWPTLQPTKTRSTFCKTALIECVNTG